MNNFMIKFLFLFKIVFDWGLGIGDWGLGVWGCGG
jgi:hypothetical protein